MYMETHESTIHTVDGTKELVIPGHYSMLVTVTIPEGAATIEVEGVGRTHNKLFTIRDGGNNVLWGPRLSSRTLQFLPQQASQFVQTTGTYTEADLPDRADGELAFAAHEDIEFIS